MHLRSIKLRGFKSFPDPVEVSLEPGVAVVVGPNGSGKSNVSDAIVWAAGSLTPSELRAEKPDDVLFAGGGDRAPAGHCEVELVFDNEDGGFGEELDFSEISIQRRLVRGGEGQYLVNRAPVRRTDLVELLADVGLGGSMHSIVSQGKVDAVLASRPEDRRALVEEAAGLGKFKRRRHRAELKLARVAMQVERARDVEDEVRKRLRPLALQATAAERAEKLADEIVALRARIARVDLARLDERRSEADERRTAAALARRSKQDRLSSVLADRERAEVELSDAAGAREAAVGALYRLQGAGERLTVREESTAALGGRLRDDLAEAERALGARTDETLRALEHAAREAAGAARDASAESGQAAERARHAHALVAAVERAAALDAEGRLDAIRLEREGIDRGLAELTGGSGEASRQLVALGAARERLGARRESGAALASRLGDEHTVARAQARSGAPSPAELEQRANEARAAARVASTERDDLAERARSARDRLAALERSLREREGVAPAARALAAEGERLVVSELEVEPGHEKAVAAALAWRASALLARDAGHALVLLGRARDGGLGRLDVVLDRGSRAATEPPVPGAQPLRSLASGPDDVVKLLDGIWLVDADRLLEVTAGPAITIDGYGYDATRGELWFAGETGEAVLLELDARRRALTDEADELAARADAAAHEAEEARAAAETAETAYGEVAHLRATPLDTAFLERLVAIASGVADAAGRAQSAVDRIEAPLNARLTSGQRRAAELRAEVGRLAALEAEARRDAGDAVRRAADADVVVARLGGVATVVGVAEGRDRDELLAAAAEALRHADEAAARAPERGRRRARGRRGARRARTASKPARRRPPPPAGRGHRCSRRVARACVRRREAIRGSCASARRCRGDARLRARRRAAAAGRRRGRAPAGGRCGLGDGHRHRGRARTARGRSGRGSPAAGRSRLGGCRRRDRRRRRRRARPSRRARRSCDAARGSP